MKAKILVYALPALILATIHLAEAQQPKKVPRIGYLSANPRSINPARIDAFRQGLRELGYTEGKNIIIEWRFAGADPDRLRTFAAELVRLPVEIIVTAGPVSTHSAKQATAAIPIVMAFHDDPVGSGVAASLARPAGNVTGLATLAPEISGKQLELLKEIIPKLSRVAVLGNASQPGTPQALREINLAADASGIKVQYLEIPDQKDIEIAFRTASKERSDAVLVLSTAILFSHRRQIVELAVTSHLPAIYNRPEYVEDGGLVTYGVSIPDLYHRAATYVDKILKGAKPADLPVEQPKKFELIINLKAAKQIGLTIPPNVLARADKVIR